MDATCRPCIRMVTASSRQSPCQSSSYTHASATDAIRASLRGVIDSSGLPYACPRRVRTSTKAKQSPSKATMSTSPALQRQFEATTRHPSDSRQRTARASPHLPSGDRPPVLSSFLGSTIVATRPARRAWCDCTAGARQVFAWRGPGQLHGRQGLRLSGGRRHLHSFPWWRQRDPYPESALGGDETARFGAQRRRNDGTHQVRAKI